MDAWTMELTAENRIRSFLSPVSCMALRPNELPI